MTVTGSRTPQRIVWYKHDGTVYRTDSIPFNMDAEVYAENIRRIEGHTLKYTILDPLD